MILALLIFFFSLNSFAFTLNTNINAGFSGENIAIRVTSNSTCTNAGVTNTDLLEMASEAVDKFWNRVPTSYLRLKTSGLLQTTDTKFLTGELCVTDSTTTCNESTSVPKVTEIVIACNSDTTKNFLSSNYYALTIPNNFSGKKIAGSVILINDSSNSRFSSLSRSEMVNIIGHEIGHAIGLGHTSDKAALMYYSEFSNRSRLGQDDIDGVSYLYPNKLHGCSGIFGTIILNDQAPPTIPPYFLFTLIGILSTYIFFRLPKIFSFIRNLLDSMNNPKIEAFYGKKYK